MLSDDWSGAFADFGASVSYVDWSSGSVDVGTGSVSLDTSASYVVAVPDPIRAAEAEDGRFQVTDRAFILAAGDIGSPKKGDQVIDGGVTYNVIDWRTSSDGLTHRVIGRRA